MSSAYRLQAIVFDLDGVITHTAALHAEAWKVTLDAFLHRRGAALGAVLPPFTLPGDYQQFVDGRPRYEGAAAFLRSRGIELPWGSPADAPGDNSVCAVGNAKNVWFQKLLRERGIPVDDEAVSFVRMARQFGIKTAVATSSKNGRGVLRAANLMDLFDTVIDGEDAAKNGIQGKPSPDLFLSTAAALHVKPEETAVFEDAVVGVSAAKRGGFVPVIGVGSAREALTLAGADKVIDRWGRLRLDGEHLVVLD